MAKHKKKRELKPYRERKGFSMKRANAIVDVVLKQRPVTVRQTFYKLVTILANEGRAKIDKSKGGLQAVQDLMRDMRIPKDQRIGEDPRLPEINPDHVVDLTRDFYPSWGWGSDYSSKGRMSIDFWASQDIILMVWVEKDGLTGVLNEVTSPYGISLTSSRGQPSMSQLQKAADSIRIRLDGKNKGSTAVVLVMTDCDYGGYVIANTIRRGLEERLVGYNLHIDPILLSVEQMTDWGITTRMSSTANEKSDEEILEEDKNSVKKKSKTDPYVEAHFEDIDAKFEAAGGVAELDALDSNLLREILRDQINQYVDIEDILTSEQRARDISDAANSFHRKVKTAAMRRQAVIEEIESGQHADNPKYLEQLIAKTNPNEFFKEFISDNADVTDNYLRIISGDYSKVVGDSDDD